MLKEDETQTHYLLILSQMTTPARVEQAKARRLHIDLPPEWQGPKQLGHLLLLLSGY